MPAFCDRFRNTLIVGLLLISPWAFASLHEPTRIFLNSLGTLLAGVLCLQTWFAHSPAPPSLRSRALAAITFALLLCAAIAAVNPRSSGIPWLPASVDPRATAFALWTYAGLAALFWAARRWFQSEPSAAARVTTLLVCSGGLMAIVAILHRLSGAKELLWIYRPVVTSHFYTFGPFEYRATAAQFFNLLWPLALARLLEQPSAARALLAALLMACPAITSSRGGLLMTVTGGVVFILLLAAARFKAREQMNGSLESSPMSARPKGKLAGLAAAAVIVVVLVGWLGSGPLQRRWKESGSLAKFLDLGGRLRQNDNSWRIIADHPLWGVGPGAYASAFITYGFKNAFKPPRDDPKETASWNFFYAKPHNDWLQTLAEWGPFATALIIAAFLLAALAPPSSPKPLAVSTIALWTSLLTLLLHASFDYPLQNHAILLHATLLLALCSCRE